MALAKGSCRRLASGLPEGVVGRLKEVRGLFLFLFLFAVGV